ARFRAADARRAADALPRPLAGVAPGGERPRAPARPLVPGGAAGLRAASHGSDAPARRRAVPRLPPELRGAGDPLSRPGDLARAPAAECTRPGELRAGARRL